MSFEIATWIATSADSISRRFPHFDLTPAAARAGLPHTGHVTMVVGS
jgi:hypothetical protein